MIFRFILWSILLTILFRFIIRFLIPLFRVTKVAQQKMREMQDQMDSMNQQQTPNKRSTVKSGDYIEYEEVK